MVSLGEKIKEVNLTTNAFVVLSTNSELLDELRSASPSTGGVI
jgi:hypothetical protein